LPLIAGELSFNCDLLSSTFPFDSFGDRKHLTTGI
jgi:hypothetical protein